MSATPDADLLEARRWFAQAEEQFATAEWNAQGKRWPFACFVCQQTAELALKALLMRRGDRARVHGLLHLLERLRPNCPDVAQLEVAARNLERFYIPTRYPDALPTGTSSSYFTQQDATDALADAADVLSFARRKLAQP
jgi:HEPN domain-containing protein